MKSLPEIQVSLMMNRRPSQTIAMFKVNMSKLMAQTTITLRQKLNKKRTIATLPGHKLDDKSIKTNKTK